MVWKNRNLVTIKLAQLGGPILQLLNYLIVPSKSVILRNLLDEAEYFIMQIPEDEEEMATAWREKLSQWWTVFATKSPSWADEDRVIQQSVSPFAYKSNVSYFMVEYATPHQENEFKQKKNPTGKDVLNFLKQSFVVFAPFESLTKTEVLKQLQYFLGLITRAEKLFFIYMSDINFQQTLLKHVTSKLPAELQTRFAGTSSLEAQESHCQPTLPERSPKKPSRQNFLRPKTVNNLKDFLMDEIQALEKELQEEQRIEALFSAGSSTASSESAPKCAFCQVGSHPMFSCPQMKRIRCDGCFRRGHTIKTCPDV